MHHLWPIYQCHRQQLAFLSASAVSSPRLFCLVIRSKCQQAYCLAAEQLFSSLIAQLVERYFYGMVSSAEILPYHIGLLKKKKKCWFVYRSCALEHTLSASCCI